MKLSKKKKIIIIVAAVVVIAAIATAIGVTCSKKAKSSDSAENQTVTVAVTDENGNTVTNADGQAVTQTQIDNDKTTTNKSESGKENSNSQPTKSNGKSETTTEPPTEFTTIDPKLPIELPAIPDDDYALTESLGLYVLENYYGDKYVINYDMDKSKDDDIQYVVFENNSKKTDIAYYVEINIQSGKAQQKDTKGKTKDITEDLKKFY